MRKIYFRADASSSIGYGHFIRSLSLADILKNDFECNFVTVNPTLYQISEMEKVCPHISLADNSSHYDTFLSLLKGDEIVVLDNYFFDLQYQKKIKKKGCKLVFIDDRPNQIYDVDLLINHVIGIEKKDISIMNDNNSILLGSKYALLRRAFRSAMCSKPRCDYNSQEILIAMGGTDYYDITGRIIRLLPKSFNYKINILVGDRYKFINTLRSPSIRIYQNLSDWQLVDLISKQQIIITPPSTLAYEICAVGCPLIIGSFSENHISAEKLLSQNGLAISCGDLRRLSQSKLEEKILETEESIEILLKHQKEAFDGLQELRLLTAFKNL